MGFVRVVVVVVLVAAMMNTDHYWIIGHGAVAPAGAGDGGEAQTMCYTASLVHSLQLLRCYLSTVSNFKPQTTLRWMKYGHRPISELGSRPNANGICHVQPVHAL